MNGLDLPEFIDPPLSAEGRTKWYYLKILGLQAVEPARLALYPASNSRRFRGKASRGQEVIIELEAVYNLLFLNRLAFCPSLSAPIQKLASISVVHSSRVRVPDIDREKLNKPL